MSRVSRRARNAGKGEGRVQKHRIYQVALVLLVAGISAGCGATRPNQYFELSVAPPAPSAQATPLPITIVVGRVVTSHLYHDDRIVFGTGSTELGVYEYYRWAQMPADMIQDALVSSLRATGQYRSVTRIGSSARGEFVLRSRLISFCEVDKSPTIARFEIEAELFESKSGNTVWTGSYSHDQPAEGKSMAVIVEALDHNVHDGIQQLTASLGQYFASHPPQAPAAQ